MLFKSAGPLSGLICELEIIYSDSAVHRPCYAVVSDGLCNNNRRVDGLIFSLSLLLFEILYSIDLKLTFENIHYHPYYRIVIWYKFMLLHDENVNSKTKMSFRNLVTNVDSI